MSRKFSDLWLQRFTFGQRRKPKAAKGQPRTGRRLRLESLEQRAMLAAILVTDSGDSGEGTLRDALEQAGADPSVALIRIVPDLEPIQIESSLEYAGEQTLRVLGSGATIEPAAADTAFDLLISSAGADLRLSKLTFQNGGGNGIFVPVPADREDTLSVVLNRVVLADNGEHGLFVDDQDDPGDPSDAGSDSDASVYIRVAGSRVVGNGTDASDRDGIRVDEGGLGNLTATLGRSEFIANGGDGLELDEKQEGNVLLFAHHSTFDGNGFQDPADLEDGLDIDEEDEGSIVATLLRVSANDNDDEGIDLDEAGDGRLYAALTWVEANGNADEGIKFDEADEGSIVAALIRVRVDENGDDGVQMDELGEGNLLATVIGSSLTNNQGAGIKVGQEAPGRGRLLVRRSEFEGNADGPIEADGVVVIERLSFPWGLLGGLFS